MASGKIRDLRNAKDNLRKQVCGLVNQIKKLEKELDKYSDVEIKVALTVQEKQMILNALDMPEYKAKAQDPKTNFFIRAIYKNLKEKIKESIKE